MLCYDHAPCFLLHQSAACQPLASQEPRVEVIPITGFQPLIEICPRLAGTTRPPSLLTISRAATTTPKHARSITPFDLVLLPDVHGHSDVRAAEVVDLLGHATGSRCSSLRLHGRRRRRRLDTRFAIDLPMCRNPAAGDYEAGLPSSEKAIWAGRGRYSTARGLSLSLPRGGGCVRGGALSVLAPGPRSSIFRLITGPCEKRRRGRRPQV